MYDIKTRNSVLGLFNGIDVDKFPDKSFELLRDEPGYDQIYIRYLPINRLVCSLFDIVEKYIRPNTDCITLIVFKSSVVQNIDESSLKLLLNKLVELLGKDEYGSGEFTEEDAKQIKQGGNWAGRTWLTIIAKGVSLIVNRNGDYFELHLKFLS